MILRNKAEDRQNAINWAREMLGSNALILDTETVGLTTPYICQVAIFTMDGDVLLDTIVRPICTIPAEATAIHGITNEWVQTARPLGYWLPTIENLLFNQTVITYNAEFDKRAFETSLQAYAPEQLIVHDWLEEIDFDCAMRWYAAFVGDWDEKRNNYKWHRLPGAAHDAAMDCQAVLRLIHKMANTEE